jgi:hypothetical protein
MRAMLTGSRKSLGGTVIVLTGSPFVLLFILT